MIKKNTHPKNITAPFREQATGSPGKTYRFYTGVPQWPFGFGLSYTTWGYAWKHTPRTAQPAKALARQGQGAGLVFEVVVTNTGGVDAATTVQLYVRQTNVPDAPLRQLAGLAKVFVKAGESTDVTINTTECVCRGHATPRPPPLDTSAHTCTHAHTRARGVSFLPGILQTHMHPGAVVVVVAVVASTPPAPQP